MVQIHEFNDTGEAYDASQCDDNIKDGDILVTKTGVVGIMCKAWPVAITANAESFHQPMPGETIATVFPEVDYTESLQVAEQCAQRIAQHEPAAIMITYSTIDHFRERWGFPNIAAAQAYAFHWIGPHPSCGRNYAISDDGVGKIQVSGATLQELFPAPT